MTTLPSRQHGQQVHFMRHGLRQAVLLAFSLLLAGISYSQTYTFSSNFYIRFEDWVGPGSTSGVYTEGSNPDLLLSVAEQGSGSCGYVGLETGSGNLYVVKCGISVSADADALVRFRLNSGGSFPLTSLTFRPFCYRPYDTSPYETATFYIYGFKNNVQTGSITLSNLQHNALTTVNFGSYTGFSDVDELRFLVNDQDIIFEELVMAPSTPSITTSGTLSAFSSCSGSASTQQSFTVGGTNLSANLVVTAPTGFQVSTSSGSGYGSSVSLTPSSGTVANTSIYVRMASSATGTPSGNVTCTSTGATTRNVSASGTVNALPTITLGTVSGVSTSATSFSIPYSATTGSPNQYSLSTTAPTSMSGFSTVTNASLASSPLSISIPASPANTYNFSLSVRNSTTGCSSSATGFTLTVSSPIVAPSISTTAAATIQSTSAVLGGNVTADGGASVSARGIVYSSTDATPTIGEPGVSNVAIGSGTGSFSQTVSGLTLGTTYYFAAYATNSAGTAYGTVSSFAAACNGGLEGGLATHEENASISMGGSSQFITTAVASNCRTIALLTPWGASPVSGTVNAKVWVRNTVPYHAGRPFVPRSYEITPTTNASTATGRVTLYFTQADFDRYNSVPNGADLPMEPTDAAGNIPNLRVFKFAGTSSDGSGMPGSFTQSGSLIIDPADNDIIWNASLSRWEVSFNTTGFSGFFVANNDMLLLPITLASFEGSSTPAGNLLIWQTSTEINAKAIEVERSADGRAFVRIATVPAKGQPASYRYTDATAAGTQYYRLRLVDKDGTATYSGVLQLSASGAAATGLQLYPNPVRQQVQLRTALRQGTVVLFNAHGVQLWQQPWQQGQLIDVSALPAGRYQLQLSSGSQRLQVPLIKQ